MFASYAAMEQSHPASTASALLGLHASTTPCQSAVVRIVLHAHALLLVTESPVVRL